MMLALEMHQQQGVRLAVEGVRQVVERVAVVVRPVEGVADKPAVEGVVDKPAAEGVAEKPAVDSFYFWWGPQEWMWREVTLKR